MTDSTEPAPQGKRAWTVPRVYPEGDRSPKVDRVGLFVKLAERVGLEPLRSEDNSINEEGQEHG